MSVQQLFFYSARNGKLANEALSEQRIDRELLERTFKYHEQNTAHWPILFLQSIYRNFGRGQRVKYRAWYGKPNIRINFYKFPTVSWIPNARQKSFLDQWVTLGSPRERHAVRRSPVLLPAIGLPGEKEALPKSRESRTHPSHSSRKERKIRHRLLGGMKRKFSNRTVHRNENEGLKRQTAAPAFEEILRLFLLLSETFRLFASPSPLLYY